MMSGLRLVQPSVRGSRGRSPSRQTNSWMAAVCLGAVWCRSTWGRRRAGVRSERTEIFYLHLVRGAKDFRTGGDMGSQSVTIRKLLVIGPYLTMRALLVKIVPFLKERALPSPITALALPLWR